MMIDLDSMVWFDKRDCRLPHFITRKCLLFHIIGDGARDSKSVSGFLSDGLAGVLLLYDP